MSTRRSSSSPRFRSRCTAGRATTSAGSRTPARRSAGAWRSPGNYPGKARTPDELRADLDQALALIPGTHRLNLHASYAETGGKKVERDALEPAHFQGWIDWAKGKGMGMDFNPTYFAHPKAAEGLTLAHPDAAIRKFWVDHGIVCRRIGAAFGKALGSACVTNVWIPDGMKDTPIDRKGPRQLLTESLDAIFAEPLDPKHNLDAVEGKLFGLGSESYVVGSHEFYLGYAVSRKKLLCLDAGHYHPTEVVSDKISAVLNVLDEILLHVSRGVRWDSDHVVILSDELEAIAQELVRGDYLNRVHIGLDFFDASINRIAAWVIGTRCMLKALLIALLEPTPALRQLEAEGNYTGRLALLEELKTMPFGAVWDFYCHKSGVPVGPQWIEEVAANAGVCQRAVGDGALWLSGMSQVGRARGGIASSHQDCVPAASIGWIEQCSDDSGRVAPASRGRSRRRRIPTNESRLQDSREYTARDDRDQAERIDQGIAQQRPVIPEPERPARVNALWKLHQRRIDDGFHDEVTESGQWTPVRECRGTHAGVHQRPQRGGEPSQHHPDQRLVQRTGIDHDRVEAQVQGDHREEKPGMKQDLPLSDQSEHDHVERCQDRQPHQCRGGQFIPEVHGRGPCGRTPRSYCDLALQQAVSHSRLRRRRDVSSQPPAFGTCGEFRFPLAAVQILKCAAVRGATARAGAGQP